MMVMTLIMKIIFLAPDSYVKLKNIVPIKDSNKKVCSQAYLEGHNFIDHNKNVNKYKIFFLDCSSTL